MNCLLAMPRGRPVGKPEGTCSISEMARHSNEAIILVMHKLPTPALQGNGSWKAWGCNGRALGRVTKEKHRPNRHKLPKNVRKLCFRPLRAIFGYFSDTFSTFFGHFVGIPIFWAVQRFARYKHGAKGWCLEDVQTIGPTTTYIGMMALRWPLRVPPIVLPST